MNASEKDALLQFMGQIYGETKKNDQMLVGQSTNLQPKSDEIKRQFEQTLRAPVQNTGAQPPQPVAAPTVAAPVTPEQAAAELAQLQQEQAVVPIPVQVVSEPAFVDPNQLEFDMNEPSKMDKLIDLIERQNKILLEIRDSNVKSKHNAKRAKNTKPS
jgi:hypothetical protein